MSFCSSTSLFFGHKDHYNITYQHLLRCGAKTPNANKPERQCPNMDLIVDFPQQSNIGSPQHITPKVSFADQLEVRCIENFSREHRDDLWFSSRELRSFRYQAELMVTMNTSQSQMKTSQDSADLDIQDAS
eukprot:90833_1